MPANQYHDLILQKMEMSRDKENFFKKIRQYGWKLINYDQDKNTCFFNKANMKMEWNFQTSKLRTTSLGKTVIFDESHEDRLRDPFKKLEANA